MRRRLGTQILGGFRSQQPAKYNGQTMENLIVGALIFLVGFFCHSFLPSYMKKKGENLATKEDIKDLAAQTALLTQTAKDIEAQISDKVWNKQRQWEMKRDALVSAVQALGRADAGLLLLASAYTMARKHGEDVWAQKVGETKLAWSDLINTFDEKRFAAELICTKELASAMRAAAIEIRLSAKKVFNEKIDDYGVISKPIQEKIGKVRELVRSELGIESEPTV